ncbi:hypothetical protein KOR34_48020 [Posidoniimonas corsicana]|uniref:Plasmid stabilization system protein n=1 Tax=Posidoniimonas corsicana TaxID=1938618 RepID=A0A5C5UV75_9BACT|nr:type II toxin-antitoxin system RelE/ParE family toxin [Posidoniimonas corsicana]TWT30244.1 hypothetical protein KOR34_48020 [Posidoniimonas corsicana]
MSYSVFVTEEAQRQLLSSAVWWAQHRSVEQAERWLAGFESSIAGLSENADRHLLAAEDGSFDFDLRQLNFGVSGKPTHRALFRIHGSVVEVLAVRHLSQRDLKSGDL